MKYSGAKTNCISFPLGGIGAGSVGLSGQGELIDWDIANRPNKGSRLGHTHLAVRAEKAGEVVAARVLHADLPPPYTGQGPGMYDNSGHGVDRRTQAGLPHFASLEFDAEFPFATLTFSEKEFPVAVTLRAFSPFIPLNEDDSSLPAACFEVEFANHSDSEYDLTSIFALSHYFKGPGAATAAAPGRLRFADAACPADSPQYGELTLATDAENTSFQRHWFRGAWFDSLTKYWHDLNQPGPLRDRELNTEGLSNPEIDTGMLAAHVRVAPGESKRVRWVLAWYFPNCENYWNPMPEGQVNQWRNHYATRFESSDAVAGYMLGNWTRLEEASRRFSRALYRSTLPEAALDRAASNLSVLKSATCFRLEEGAFYAFEGCHSTTGSCEGSCTHVWNYAYAMPFLFPRLERSMRELDFKYNMNAIGGMYFRLQLPLGRPGGFRPCVDGHMGGVIKTCREWKISGDAAWLRRLWPQLKANLAYAWHPDNPDRWDPEKTGVIWGRQHHTLDMELFGPNSWLTGFYLAALKAGTDMAEALGDAEAAAEYRAIFERGRKWVAENLVNGE